MALYQYARKVMKNPTAGENLALASIASGAGRLAGKLLTKQNLKLANKVVKTMVKKTGKSRKRKRSTKTVVCRKLESRVKKLERRDLENEVTHIDKYERMTVYQGIQGYATYQETNQNNRGTIQAVLGRLETWDPVTGNFISGNFGTTGNDQKDFNIESVSNCFKYVNNNFVKCKVTVYACYPKIGLESGAISKFTDGIADSVTNATTMTIENRLLYPSMVPAFLSSYRIAKTRSKVLGPGQSWSFIDVQKNIKHRDEVAYNTFDPRLKSCIYMVRFEGLPSHHQTNGVINGVGASDIRITEQFKQIVIVKYDGGVRAVRIHVNDSTNRNGNADTYRQCNKGYAGIQAGTV
jgi:hypothetical protein